MAPARLLYGITSDFKLILDKYAQVSQQVGLNLPKLKKSGTNQSQGIQLPKLKKL